MAAVRESSRRLPDVAALFGGRHALTTFALMAIVLHGWRLLMGTNSAIRLGDVFDSEWPRFVGGARALVEQGLQAWTPLISGGMPANAFHFSQLHPLVLAHVMLPPWAVYDILLGLNWFLAAYGLYRLIVVNFSLSPQVGFWLGFAYATFAQADIVPVLPLEAGFPLVVSLLHAPGRRLWLAAIGVAVLAVSSYPILNGPALAVAHAILLLLLSLYGGLDLRRGALTAAIFWLGLSVSFIPCLISLVDYVPYQHRDYGPEIFAESGWGWWWINTIAWVYALPGVLGGALAAARWDRRFRITIGFFVVIAAVCALLNSQFYPLIAVGPLQKMDLWHLSRLLPSLSYVIVAIALGSVSSAHQRQLYVAGAVGGLLLMAITAPLNVFWPVMMPRVTTYWLPAIGVAVLAGLLLFASPGMRFQRPSFRQSDWRPVAVVAAALVLVYCGILALGRNNTSSRYGDLYADDGTYAALLAEAKREPFRISVSGILASPAQVAGLEALDGRSPIFDRTFRDRVGLVPRNRPTDRSGAFWTYWQNLKLTDLVGHPFSAATLRLPVLASMNVRYLVSTQPIDGLERVAVVPQASRLQVYRVPGAKPRGYFAADARVVETRADVERALAGLADSEWGSTAVLARADGAPAPPDGQGDCGQSVLTSYQSDRIAFDLAPLRSCVLVVATNFHHHWRARIDGREVPLFRTNLAFQGVVVPAGAKQLRLQFEPPLFPAILALVPLGMLIAGSAVVVGRGRRRASLAGVDCVVLAGGLGTRIAPMLGEIPKLLAPIGTKPFLLYLLRWLRRAGLGRVVFALGHRAEKIVDYLQTNPVGDIAVETVVEPAPLGTAGALRHARRLLHSDPVLVINGDTFIDADLDALLRQHRRTGARATLLCTEVADADRYGSVDVDASGFIRAFREKDAQSGRALINAGVYLLSAALLDDIADGTAASLERDVFAREPQGTLAAWVGGAHFIDIGTPDSLRQAFDVLKAAGVDVS